MRNICIVVTARPSYARVKTLLAAIKKHPKLKLSLIITGSALLDKYGSVINVIKKDGFEPTSIVHISIEGESLLTSAKSTGLGIIELSNTFHNLKPDIVISIADRYETIATAIASSYQNIPVAHIQGGEVTGSIDEKVRHSVTKLSDFHFVSNEDAANRIIKMGEIKKNVYISGCPSIDLAKSIENKKISNNISLPLKGVGYNIDLNQPFLMVMQHPVTYEWNKAFDHINTTLSAIDELNIQTIWFWPNVDAGSDDSSRAIRIFRENKIKNKIRFVKNLPPEEFLLLLKSSICLVGNSSVGIRECSYLGIPVVNIGTRQDGRKRGKNVLDVTYEKKSIKNGILNQIDKKKFKKNTVYGDGFAGKFIADVLSKIELISEKKITY